MKSYVSPNKLHQLSYQLGLKVLEDKYRPTWIIGLWRGGCPPAMVVQAMLKYYNCHANHTAIKTCSYDQEGQQKQVVITGCEYLFASIKNTDHVLIVDDIFDTGKSVDNFLNKMKNEVGDRYPASTKIATVYYKPQNNKTTLVPDYFVEATDKWIVFPHEFEDLTKEEIKEFMQFDMPESF